MKTTRTALSTLSLLLLTGLSLYAAESKATTPIAKVGDVILTEEDLKKDVGMNLYEAENALFQLKKNWVDQKARAILAQQAAKEAKLTVQAWQAKEIDSKVAVPTSQEIDQLAPRFAVRNSTTPPTEAEYARMKEQAKQALLNQRRSQQESAVFQQLAAKAPLQLFFAQPELPKIDVSYGADDPVRGPKSAPITIIEFTDFQCPYCKRSQDTLKQVEAVYGDKVKIVEKQYPLQFHNRAKPAAEAVLCAKEQGKFWELHDKLFPSQSLEDADITRFATEVGLNMPKFQKCLADHKYAAKVEADTAEGLRYGVRGTPHFFINGRPINGAQPFEAFKTVIDQELEKLKS